MEGPNSHCTPDLTGDELLQDTRCPVAPSDNSGGVRPGIVGSTDKETMGIGFL